MRRHHPGRAARSGDGRKQRNRQSRPPGRGADNPDCLRDQPAARSCAAGTASISRCRSAAAFSFGASRSRSRPISMRPGSKQARLLVETRMNEMARQADCRVGHFTPMRSSDQLRSAHLRRADSGWSSARIPAGAHLFRASGRGTVDGWRGPAFLSAALLPSAYRAATAAATPLVRCYLRRARQSRQGRSRADCRTLWDCRRRPAARNAGLDPCGQYRRSAFGTGPDRADDSAAPGPRNPADHRNRGIGAAAGRAVAEPCPASVRACRPAARRAAVPRPLAS